MLSARPIHSRCLGSSRTLFETVVDSPGSGPPGGRCWMYCRQLPKVSTTLMVTASAPIDAVPFTRIRRRVDGFEREHADSRIRGEVTEHVFVPERAPIQQHALRLRGGGKPLASRPPSSTRAAPPRRTWRG